MIPLNTRGQEPKIIVVPPRKVFSYNVRITKSRVGKRRVRVRKFIGWREVLKDGQIITQMSGSFLCMNQTTEKLVSNELKRCSRAFKYYGERFRA